MEGWPPSLQHRRSAIVVPFELPEPLERIRAAETDDARRGVPAHVTLVFPFLDPPAIDRGVLATVTAIFKGAPPFDVSLARVEFFERGGEPGEGVMWLAPEPGEPFVALVEALVAAFPEQRPYAGQYDEVIPHLTLATGPWSRIEAVAAGARSELPIQRRVDEAALLLEDAAGRWAVAECFRLGRA